ncbi:MAG: SDR family oxidoreductase [Bacteroidota bacterium]
MGRIVIIGGSKGIGRAILEQQLQRGPCVNISRTAPAISSPNLEHHSADILSDELPDVDDISTLVYCPGSINLRPIGSLKEDDFRNDFEINVLGAVKAVRKYHRKLKRAEGASIVLFSTVAVRQGMAFHASVAASKGAIEGLTKSLAAELAPSIRVNAIAPSITDTPLAAHLLKNEETIEKMKARHPLKRIITPTEIAATADWLISQHAASVTGQIISVDAGMSSIR